MRTIILILALLVPCDTLSVMFWNVENFFDWRNDSTTVSDLEFSPAGERHWTWKRFQAKANAFAKTLFWIEGETGRLPDIVGLEEVENSFVLRQVLTKTALRKTDYKYIHYDSPDHRGIDVALLYRASALALVDSKPCHLYAADTVMTTRDILLCIFRRVTPGSTSVTPGLTGSLPDEPSFAVLVNHHPSKYGGAAESEPRRRVAVQRLRFLADSLAAAGIDRIIAGGDFNDTPDNPVFRLLEPALIPLHMDLYRRGQGTIKYDGKWDLIDHIYVSPGWADPSMRILRIPFLLTRDNVHSGEKPLRTYTGPRHTAGVSDHLPVLLETAF
jgi:predicted extracellular nuclease